MAGGFGEASLWGEMPNRVRIVPVGIAEQDALLPVVVSAFATPLETSSDARGSISAKRGQHTPKTDE